jgi:drug/metabolite transporter (DMT)-like permease
VQDWQHHKPHKLLYIVLLVMLAIEKIGAGLTAQVGMIDPIARIAMSVLILDEPLTPWVIAGTLLVVGGVWLVTKFGSVKTPPSPQPSPAREGNTPAN